MRGTIKAIKLIFTIIFITITVSTSTYTTADVNQDGIVTSMDLLIAKRYILGYTELSQKQINTADLNSDGLVSEKDLSIIKAYVLNQ